MPTDPERHALYVDGLERAAAHAPDAATSKWLGEFIRKERDAFEATPAPYGFEAVHADDSHPDNHTAADARRAEAERNRRAA